MKSPSCSPRRSSPASCSRQSSASPPIGPERAAPCSSLSPGERCCRSSCSGRSGGFWQMLLATLLLAFNWTTIMPLIEAVAVSGVRSAGLDYGRVRLWGSGSFILASVGAGLVIGQFGAVLGDADAGGSHGADDRGRLPPAARGCEQALASHARASPHQPRRRRQARPLALLPAVPARRQHHPGKPRALLHVRHAALARRKASPTEPSARCGRSASSPRSGCSPSQDRSSRAGARRAC